MSEGSSMIVNVGGTNQWYRHPRGPTIIYGPGAPLEPSHFDDALESMTGCSSACRSHPEDLTTWCPNLKRALRESGLEYKDESRITVSIHEPKHAQDRHSFIDLSVFNRLSAGDRQKALWRASLGPVYVCHEESQVSNGDTARATESRFLTMEKAIDKLKGTSEADIVPEDEASTVAQATNLPYQACASSGQPVSGKCVT